MNTVSINSTEFASKFNSKKEVCMIDFLSTFFFVLGIPIPVG